jgi:acyl-CoA thioesterase-1
MRRLGTSRLLVASLAAILGWSGPSSAEPVTSDALSGRPPSCATPPLLTAIDSALDRTAARIQAEKPVTIVAMGSSSTQGVGASAPRMSYPSRLEQELKYRYPNLEIRVINHGIGGQDVGEELIRLDHDVLAQHPDLVIWQLGTNAVLRRDDLTADEQLIRRGVALLKENAIDVILMDLQYAPRVLERRAYAEMERLIAEIARRAHVGLFRRFEIMKEWDNTHQLAPGAMIGPDGLHMTDASYGCLANQLAEALSWNWRSHAKLAKSPQRSPAAVAGMEKPASAVPVEISRQP